MHALLRILRLQSGHWPPFISAHPLPAAAHCERVTANAISPVKRTTQAPGATGKPPRHPVQNINAVAEGVGESVSKGA